MRWFAVSLFILIMCFSSNVSAQLYGAEGSDPAFISSTTTSTAVGVGAVMLSVSFQKEPTNTVQAFLLQNRDQFRREVAFGGGATIHDLGQLLAIDDKRFGTVLRQNRVAIFAYLSDDLSPDATRAFISLVREKMPTS